VPAAGPGVLIRAAAHILRPAMPARLSPRPPARLRTRPGVPAPAASRPPRLLPEFGCRAERRPELVLIHRIHPKA
jgi:hypothetical protein